MRAFLPRLPDGGWQRVIAATGTTTVIVSILALLGTLAANGIAGKPNHPVDFYTSIGLAALFTIPLFGFLMVKVQQLSHANRQLHLLATTDFLTGTLSRRAFMEEVETSLSKYDQSTYRTESALLVIDVDHFKRINDRYGHQVGDLALIRIADTLRENLRPNDPLCRLGGEEFGVFLDMTSAVEAVGIAERCRRAITECSFSPENEDHELSISIGIAITVPGEDFTSLFKEADNQLYLAKAHGRNRIELPGLSSAAA